ncbi:MAG TPA: peptidoglycan bridge formation glycyltransferase FemA/FemB family protein [Candidatus Saccharimonadales bacterium]|nr:peptidoglycan bridge formation glycyltransferase FemA/FemB family protein [Candidatus Saccharimonadales bacterium]
MRFAQVHELEHWDELIIESPNGGDVFQTKAFAQIKQSQGWMPQYVIYDVKNIACLYLSRKVPLIGELWYSPKGPGATNVTDFEQILKENQEFAQDKKIFAFKMEPEILQTDGYPKDLHKVHNIQPNASTVIIDLSPNEAAILATFRQRARRAIRQAEAAGVTAEPVTPTQENFEQMYKLYKGTGERAGFHVRDFNYHRSLWQKWIDAHQGQLFFAYHNKQVIAGVFIALIGKKGLYKDGASDRDALKSGAAHLLQWRVMQWLKSRGVTKYDLHGTPPADQLENTQHKFYGLGLFKTSFSNSLTEFVGTLDQPINQNAYKAWCKLGERASQSLEYRFKNRTFY